MKRFVWPIALIAVAGAALMYMVMNVARPPSQDKIPPDLQVTLDSMGRTQLAHDLMQDSLTQLQRQDSILRAAEQLRAQMAASRARLQKMTADSLAAMAQTADEWHAAHDARAKEAQEWQASAAAKDSALTLEIAAHARTKFQLTEETKRRVELETVIVPGLRETIASLEKPCRVARYIPCPSRTVTGLLGAGLGYAAGQQVAQLTSK